MTNGPASYRDRIPGHVADDAVVQLSLAGSLSKFSAEEHPEVTVGTSDGGAVVLEGPAGAVRRAAAAFRRQDATPVTTPLADPDRNTFPYSFQSMIVAFVIAMAARSFVAEGFVIPTGSMAPTLRGQHLLMRGPQTGGEFAVGLQVGAPPPISAAILNNAADRLLGPRFPGTAKSEGWSAKPRQGDRILTHKTLYHFRDPRRWEVVVFRNPANPFGRCSNLHQTIVRSAQRAALDCRWRFVHGLRPRMNPWIGMRFEFNASPIGCSVRCGCRFTTSGTTKAECPPQMVSGPSYRMMTTGLLRGLFGASVGISPRSWNGTAAREFTNWNAYNVGYGNTPDGRGRILKGYTYPAPEPIADIAFEANWTPSSEEGSLRWILEANQHRFEVERVADVIRSACVTMCGRKLGPMRVGPSGRRSRWIPSRLMSPIASRFGMPTSA